MASSRIYLLHDDAALVAMQEQPYDSERLLQELLAKHPDLLAGEQVDAHEPRRWVLVTREMGVPGEEDGAGRWSLDHLFLDQDGVPTLVEVKRSSDTRIRREVVGQMLDYAANAVVYWPVEEIRAKFESQCEEGGSDSEEELAALIGDDGDTGEFWQHVKTNLQAGRVRLVFIADLIPQELRRVVEFLNTQMDPAEVLAIEIKQFVGEGMRTLVPRVLGQTATAQQKKGGGSVTLASVEEFYRYFDAARPEPERRLARRVVEWAQDQGLTPGFTLGAKGASFIPFLTRATDRVYPVSLQSRGKLVFQMRWLKKWPPFDRPEKREEFRAILSQLPDAQIAAAGMEGFPRVPLSAVADEAVWDQLRAAMTWLVKEIRGK
jgi:hypothetical protein